MKIDCITAIPLSFRFPEGKAVAMGIGTARKRDVIIVKIQTSDGIVGYGEAHPGRSPGAVASLVNNTLAPLLHGRPATDVIGAWELAHRMQLASHGLGAGAALALSGIDMALWDIRAKAAHMPLYRMLGGSARRVPAYAGGVALGYQPPPSLADEAVSHIEKGYRAIKLRMGDTSANDIARLTAVRKKVGDHIDILVDANTAYTLADVRQVMPAFAELHVKWLEEPFPCNDFASYRLAAQLNPLVPLAAGENHYTRYEFARLVEDRAVTIFQPDLSKTGGITEALRIAALASAWRIPVNPHSSAGGLNMASSIHFLSSIDNGGYFEACVSQVNPLRDMFGPPFEIGQDGCVQALDKPGIGLDVDETAFSSYPLIDGLGYDTKL
ncbi:mandelate racemase/muconate lactonizing enzyme family protein [Candidimonas nitroreducens]|uniref:Mandelate racemase n=1 Tax=Candidimonas nitroreducens TaxID=683354 RepID=A0A225N3P1_9BURK|nr:mandelate racemase/muconate lactonizing enzyme family protein [Candidimonas nitroreducens]OWT65649.1 mandelate racemase [Candidimonas nitroreducens]